MTAVQVIQPHATVTGPVNFETTAEMTVLPVSGEVYYKRELNDEEKTSIHDLLPGLVHLYDLKGTPRPYATTQLFAGGIADPRGFRPGGRGRPCPVDRISGAEKRAGRGGAQVARFAGD
jgi:hypothetical protein